jgi:hypothetical protein
MYMDIYLYGVPLEVDTGANESGHKEVKIAAKLTQKNESTFDFQTSTRLMEFYLFDLAVAELEEEQKLWEYFHKEEDPPPEEPPPPNPPTTGGERITVWQDDVHGQDPVYSLGKGKKSRVPWPLDWDKELLKFLYQLQNKLHVTRLDIRGQHKRGNVIFRGAPNYREKPWRDWALFDWGENILLPGQIWCFVVIDSIPGGGNPVIHGAVQVENATYAVVECAYPDERRSEKIKSDLFLPMNKEVLQMLNEHRDF